MIIISFILKKKINLKSPIPIPPGRYGKMYTFSVSQIYNSNIYLIQLHLDNDYILILEKSKFKSISIF